MKTFKIMMLGEIGVGKTSLVRRLVLDRFEANYKPTLGVDIYTYEIPPTTDDGTAVKLLVWDTDGNFSDQMFRHVYMREAHASLIVSDVTRPATLTTAATLSQGFRKTFPGRHHALVLNKLDLMPEDEPLEIPPNFAPDHVPVIKTSAKSGSNVEAAFQNAAETLLRREV